MRIAIFDYSVTPNNPAGGCHYRMIRGLCREHEFTVFAAQFENPCPERIRWVPVPAPRRPDALTYTVFHAVAPIYYFWDKIRNNFRPDLVQFTETNFAFGDVAYAHFCFRAYLRLHWKTSRPGGLRRFAHWLAMHLRAATESYVFGHVGHIVVPSEGLARELKAEFPSLARKIHVIPNPVDSEHMRRPNDFSRTEMRRSLGFVSEDIVLIFVALGAYERKGLPLLMQALARLVCPKLKLLVVGGLGALRKSYQARAARMGIDSVVRFIETQPDIRPYLWSADALAFPSCYEVFPLVTLEAAAAGLPLLVTPLYGVEDLLRDGQNGILLERSVDGVATGLRRFLEFSPRVRVTMGDQARLDVSRYDTSNFVASWNRFYIEMYNNNGGSPHCHRPREIGAA